MNTPPPPTPTKLHLQLAYGHLLEVDPPDLQPLYLMLGVDGWTMERAQASWPHAQLRQHARSWHWRWADAERKGDWSEGFATAHGAQQAAQSEMGRRWPVLMLEVARA